jgi:hypothetical protein
MSELYIDAVLGYRSRSSLPAEAWLFILVLIAVIAICAWYFGAHQRLKRQLKQAKPWSLNELPEDTHGRVIGQARALGEQLQGPLTGRPCVYYIAMVEEQRSTGRSTHWRTVAQETRGVPFILEDGTGRAIVDPNGAQVALDFDGNSKSGTFNNADPVQEPDPNAAPEAAYRGAPPTRLRLTSSPRFPLIISDDPATTRPT